LSRKLDFSVISKSLKAQIRTRAGHRFNSSPPIRRAAASLQEIPGASSPNSNPIADLNIPFNCSTAALAAMSQDSGAPWELRATVDVPSRFASAKAVGAAFGLTPRRRAIPSMAVQ
jgi:hypothetical protein